MIHLLNNDCTHTHFASKLWKTKWSTMNMRVVVAKIELCSLLRWQYPHRLLKLQVLKEGTIKLLHVAYTTSILIHINITSNNSSRNCSTPPSPTPTPQKTTTTTTTQKSYNKNSMTIVWALKLAMQGMYREKCLGTSLPLSLLEKLRQSLNYMPFPPKFSTCTIKVNKTKLSFALFFFSTPIWKHHLHNVINTPVSSYSCVNKYIPKKICRFDDSSCRRIKKV